MMMLMMRPLPSSRLARLPASPASPGAPASLGSRTRVASPASPAAPRSCATLGLELAMAPRMGAAAGLHYRLPFYRPWLQRRVFGLSTRNEGAAHSSTFFRTPIRASNYEPNDDGSISHKRTKSSHSNERDIQGDMWPKMEHWKENNAEDFASEKWLPGKSGRRRPADEMKIPNSFSKAPKDSPSLNQTEFNNQWYLSTQNTRHTFSQGNTQGLIKSENRQQNAKADDPGLIMDRSTNQIRGPLATTAFKPFMVKNGKSFPSSWDGPGGTVALIDKPLGWTSFSVCGKLRKLLGIKKVGHAGTLDPLATGLLIVCLGKATKLADSYQAMTKVYSGTLRLGESTPSYDMDTPVNETSAWEHVTEELVEKCKPKFIGDILQIPPMYSAIKVKGEKMYDKARKGQTVDLPPRPVSIFSFETWRDEKDRQNFHFRVVCSKGTYIRSLCYDFGRELNTCAHLVALRREKIGEYSVEDAFTMADLEKEIIKDKNLHGLFSRP